MSWFSSIDDARDMSDEELLTRSQVQPWLFAVLLDRYEAAFLRRATSIIFDPRDAEEIVQDTFTKIYLNATKFSPQDGAKFSSWAYRILLNTSYTYYVKRRKNGERFTSLDPEFEALVSDKNNTVEAGLVGDAIERVLARLPGHFASVLRLHYLERWSQEDIAAETGEAVGTIKARIHRAKAAFRKMSTKEQQEHLL
ncbi:MAG: polymerase sigma factor SigW [Candidatus Parcubacteria bacterium]|jgi:RNA polymerase sigma-70 factor (ECF subfamily)